LLLIAVWAIVDCLWCAAQRTFTATGDYVRHHLVTEIREPPVHKPEDHVFSPEKVPKKLDAIVLGSDIAGLATAAMLSRAGKVKAIDSFSLYCKMT
jgi:pyruvate/2-oxoglutarate dehydrogenase complex dihydrolipoamide dehydrogenase (E3) component